MPTEEPLVRAMTWNIHGTFGRNTRYDLKQVVELVRRWNPGVVALQEIDSRRRDPVIGDPFKFIQDELGHYGIGAKSIQTADGEYGQMLLSRWPLVSSEIHDISWPEREPRRAIRAVVDSHVGRFTVVATHLGLALRERGAQTRKLLELACRDQHAVLLLGDFNDWVWAGSVRRSLAAAMPSRTRHRTFPSHWPLLYLDRIYCRAPGTVVRSWTDLAAREVSDHLAVIADVNLAGSA